ncbi:Polyamine aminopropyltransferase [Seminavis robusta]|uniref:thermospermine synthase n=1 Tax=Seminavis robusta TaxID=568900 RepID=A0A9N8H7J7_9STRA|nr:Polyamine aminopropyltransferase [Seminavis robusta]|eukprot:Sro182_g079330.1 Polyamine aminopropyltransferase (347) ;mRNA; r:42078-43212
MTESGEKNPGIEAQRAKMSFLFREDVAPGLRLEMDLNKILFTSESEFQQIDVVETFFGKTLVTDGKTQSSQMDEFAYHESLVHPSMLRSALSGTPPKTVFIGGGGELATAREVLRHKSIERCVMVDIDGKVIEVCKKFLAEWGGETVTSDKRFELVVGDAHKWMMETQETFDVIIMDISDPIEAGPGIMLYTKEFYEHALTRLNPNGVFVTQSGTADAVPAKHQGAGETDTSCYGPINNTLRTVFDCVVPYSTNIPSFGGDWGFIMAFQAPAGCEDKALVEKEWKFPASTDVIDNLVEQQIEGGADKLGLYDGVSHMSMFALTKALRNLLKNDTRVMTRDNPVFMY